MKEDAHSARTSRSLGKVCRRGFNYQEPNQKTTVLVKGVASQGEVVDEAHPSACWARGRLGGWFHFLELLASWQMPKLVLVMKPIIDLSASQVRPHSQGHL